MPKYQNVNTMRVCCFEVSVQLATSGERTLEYLREASAELHLSTLAVIARWTSQPAEGVRRFLEPPV
jgi:hypothetical protein